MDGATTRVHETGAGIRHSEQGHFPGLRRGISAQNHWVGVTAQRSEAEVSALDIRVSPSPGLKRVRSEPRSQNDVTIWRSVGEIPAQISRGGITVQA